MLQKRIEKLNELGLNWNSNIRIRSLQKWELMYQKAKEYYETNGHLKVSWKYVTDDGLKLGYWISMIRKVRKGTVKHSVELTKERIKRLDEIGMIWDCRIEN